MTNSKRCPRHRRTGSSAKFLVRKAPRPRRGPWRTRPRNPCRTHPGMRRSHTDGGSPMGRMFHTQWITAASGPRTDGGWPDAHRACSGERDEIGVVGAPQVLDAVREQDDPLRLERLDGALVVGDQDDGALVRAQRADDLLAAGPVEAAG